MHDGALPLSQNKAACCAALSGTLKRCATVGQRLLSTMLVSILRTHYVWHRKKHYFAIWSKYASGRREKLLAIRNSLRQALRRRLLQRLRPAFKFWHRVALYKQKERAQVHTPPTPITTRNGYHNKHPASGNSVSWAIGIRAAFTCAFVAGWYL